jgi:hypothetical protein
VKSRDEHLIWAKQRALISVDRGDFARAVTGVRADLDEHPLTKASCPATKRGADSKQRWTRRSAGARKR